MASMAATEVTPDSSTLDRVGYLFGHPIAHSLSPLLHQTVYDNLSLNWSQIPLDSLDIPNFLRLTKDPKFYGAAVTMPHKVAIIPHLNSITQEGTDIGACNTIFLRTSPTGTRELCGTNTDCVGVREAFYQNLPSGITPESYKSKPGLVIGGGGACRSAVYALKRYMGCSPIYIVNRDVAEVAAVLESCLVAGYGDDLVHVQTAAEAQSLQVPVAIVSCVPNFPPVTPAEIEVREIINTFLAKETKGQILEMCYHPTPYTEIGTLAEGLGWDVILGTEAMIYQGLEQDRFWTGKELNELPGSEVKAVIAEALKTHSR